MYHSSYRTREYCGGKISVKKRHIFNHHPFNWSNKYRIKIHEEGILFQGHFLTPSHAKYYFPLKIFAIPNYGLF